MKQKFKIYLPFTLNEIKRQMSYKGAFYLFILINLFGPFIQYFLWKAVYGSAEGSVLGGLTEKEIVIYVFMIYVTSSLSMVSISDWVSEDVVKGQVAMNLIRPLDYRMRLIFQAFGQAIFRFFSTGFLIWVGLEIYKVTVLGMGITSISNILLYLFSCVMSFCIYVLFDFCFGMVAFFTTYIFGMLMAKEALMSFLTGQLIPLSFFPEIVKTIFEFLPFSSMAYTPVMIYLGKYSGGELLFVLGRQVAWVIILYMIGSLIWNQVTKRLVVLGG